MIGWRCHLKQSPRFSWLRVVKSSSTPPIHSRTDILEYYHLTLPARNTSLMGNRESSLSSDPFQNSIGISHPRTDNRTTNNVHGNSNTNFANVLNSYNNTINVGVSEESLRIQTWLSPLEPHARHQDVRSRRLDGVGDWVLQKDEFESWCKSQDGSANPTLLCYGGQGAGKTYIR